MAVQHEAECRTKWLEIRASSAQAQPAMPQLIVFLVSLIAQVIRAASRSKADLVLENLALRQQVATLKRSRPRPHIVPADRAFWVALRAAWSKWADLLVIVKPDTVVRWHRDRFRRYWTKLSQENRKPGRPRIDGELRSLIRKMATENEWGAPRIHGELLKLGFNVSEATISRYMPRRKPDPQKMRRWLTFLHNHKDAIAAMDFFVVPTIGFRLIYGFVIIDHGRRRVLHFNATYNPTTSWVIQQLREAFPYDTAPKYLLFDRDSIFSTAVVAFIKAIGTKPKQISYRSPWQNPVVERWIGSCRRGLLDHVIVFNDKHLLRLVRGYISYHHEDRTHLGLDKDTPTGRSVTSRPSAMAEVIALPRVGGIHHRYVWREAA